MITSNDFKRGMVIKLDGNLYSVVEYQHVKPARGAAFVRTKLRSIMKGSIVDKTFRGGEKVEDVRIERRRCSISTMKATHSFLWIPKVTSRTRSTRHTSAISSTTSRKGIRWISQFTRTNRSTSNSHIRELKVVYAEPGVKGDTATNVTKR